MSIQKAVPIIVCDDPQACGQFYVHRFGFTIGFNHDDYVALEYKQGSQDIELGFMRSSAEQPAFNGQGMILGLEVLDVDAQYERLSAEGVPFVQSPQDNPWGDRSCICIDPAGMALYLFKPIEPSEEYRSSYVKG